MQYLKEATSGKVKLGPIVKSTDGYSALTGIGTAAATGAVTFIWGTSSTGDMTTAFSWEEVGDGEYLVGLSSAILSTYCHIRINFVDSSGIPTFEDVIVLAPQVYNSLVSTGDYLEVTAVEIGSVAATAANMNIGAAAGATIAGATAFRSTFSTAANCNIGAVAGTTVVGATEFRSTFSTGALVDVGSIQGQIVTTDAADNWDNFWFNNDVVSTERVTDILTTASNVNIGAAAGTTIAGATAFRSTFSTAANVNIGAVAGSTVAGTTDFRSTFSTGALVNLGAIGGATVATGTAQLGVNIVSISSHAITSDAGDNFDRFFDNGGVVTTEVLGDLPTTADLFTSAKQVEANVIAMSSQALTTDAGANFGNFFFNNDVVSTERISELPTTADLFTSAEKVEANVIAVSSQALTTDAGANFSTYFDNGGAAATAQIGAQSTFGVGNVYDVWAHGDLMKLLQAHLLNNTTYDGSTYVLHDHAGTTFVKFEVTTAERTRTT